MNIVDTIEREQMRADLPDFGAGDTVRVHVRVVEGVRERIQVFEGVVLGRSVQGRDLQTEAHILHVTYARCTITAWSARHCSQWLWAEEKADSVSCYPHVDYGDTMFAQRLTELNHERLRRCVSLEDDR